MDVIVYSKRGHEKKESLEAAIAGTLPKGPVMVSDFGGLFGKLRSTVSARVLLVLLISSERELDRLVFQRQKFFNIKIILILPDKAEKGLSKGLLLHPRYITSAEHDFDDVSAVIEKMIQKKAFLPEDHQD